MIIKEISVKHFDENGEPLFLIRNSEDYPPEEWAKLLKYLKRNAEAKLLKYKIIAK